MITSELQNKIIRKILNTNDNQLLDYLNSILSKGTNQSLYKLTDFEKAIIQESQTDYQKGIIFSNEDVFSKNEKMSEF